MQTANLSQRWRFLEVVKAEVGDPSAIVTSVGLPATRLRHCLIVIANNTVVADDFGLRCGLASVALCDSETSNAPC